MKKAIRIFDIIFAVVCTAVFVLVGAGNYLMPDSVIINDSERAVFSDIYYCSQTVPLSTSVDYQTAQSRQRQLKLFGVVPVKNVTVTQQQRKNLYVSGESFGIKLYTDGVIVVGTQEIDINGEKINPAQKAGVQIGDVIISINNTNVYSSDDVENILNDNNGLDYTVVVKRNDRYKTFTLTPVYSVNEGCFKAGMWVRDSTAGIGTITYFDKDEGTFAALGHPINDVDTNEIMPLLEGEAVQATVTKIYKATNGSTGSLSCDFKSQVIGILTENTQSGIFGNFAYISDKARLYPVATKQEIEKGYAQILTTVDESGPQFYDVEINRISYAEDNSNKNMVIKVIDQQLIDKTGGIVQGMSGSPILQNGKLIGAVTHVLVDNPAKGYAIFAENMLETANQVDKEHRQKNAS